MSVELTPEQEKQVQERLKEQKLKLYEQFNKNFNTEMSLLLRNMKEHFGEEAYQVVVKMAAVRCSQQYKEIAEKIGDNSIEAYVKHIWEKMPQQGFECTIVESEMESEMGMQNIVTKCPIYDTAKRLGFTDEMYYFSCAGDPYMAEGFNPNIGFKRTKTLMQGDDCCDNFLYYKDKSK